jgi:hypothetical protein
MPGNSREHRRLAETRSPAAPWKKWGPYLSERQWGTVRLMHPFGTLRPEMLLSPDKMPEHLRRAPPPIETPANP